MRVFPISVLSHARGLILREPTSRLFAAPALAWTNPRISHSEQVKEGNFHPNALELNETGFLRVLTCMKNDPYLALSFLKRIERNGASPSVQAYAAVIRIVCRWGLDQKLDPLFVELIRRGTGGRGFGFMDLLKTFGEAEEDGRIPSRVSSGLVKAYAKLRMYDEAIGFFWEIEQIGLDVDAHAYVVVVRALHRNRDAEGVEKFLNRLLSSERRKPRVFYVTFVEGLCVNQMADIAYLLLRPLRDANIMVDSSDLAISYRRVVCGLCNELKLEDAESVVLDMEECGIDPDVYVYSVVIEGYRKSMNIPKALDFFHKMVQKKRGINCVIVSSILQCLCQKGEFSEAYRLFKGCRDMNVYLDRVCYNIALDALGKLGEVEEAIKLFREMTGEEGIAPDVINYTTLIGGCCLHGKCSEAFDLMIEMEGTGETPDIVTYNVLAGGLARNGLAEEAFETLKLMEARGVKPTSVTHSMVIKGLIVAGKIQEAEAFHESLEQKGEANMVIGYCEAGRLDQAYDHFIRLEYPLPKNVYFTLFTALCAEDDYICKAQDVVERMWKLGVEPGKNMYGKLIGAWCRVSNVRKAEQFLKVLDDKGIIPDLFTYTIMINTYCRLKELKQAYALFTDMKRMGIKPDVVTYTVLLDSNPELDMEKEMQALDVEPDVVYYTVMINAYCRLNEVKKAYALFIEMKRRGIEPDVVTYTVLLNSNPELDMKRDMKARGVKPDAFYYTVLIDHQCKIQDLEEAERIFNQMIESGVEPDVASYTALMAGCCKMGYMKEAKRIFDVMIERKVKPDVMSYTALIAGCYKNGYVRKAETLVEEMLDMGIEPTKTFLSAIRYARIKAKRHRP